MAGPAAFAVQRSFRFCGLRKIDFRFMEEVMDQLEQALVPVSVAHEEQIPCHIHGDHAVHHLAHAPKRHIVYEQQVDR